MNTDQQKAPTQALSPRKLPSQQRARNTVDSILQATEELVRQRGFAAVGTRLIAERAGVSVGSLYQYFPTYESILLAWYEDVAAREAQRLKIAMISVSHEDLRLSVPFAMKLLLETFEKHALVLIKMVEEMPAIAQATNAASFESLIRVSMRLYFGQHHEFKTRDIHRHLFFLENIIMGNMRRYVTDKPNHLSRKDFISHLSRIVIAYLAGDLAK